jgi:hypothetical protein
VGQIRADEIDLALVDAAVEHGVAPLLYRTLHDDPRWMDLDGAVRARLTRLAREAVLLESVRSADLARVMRALRQEGIEPLLFKGAALAVTHYPEPWMRVRGDADLLVRAEDARGTGAVLERLGFARLRRPGGIHVTQQARYIGVRDSIEIAYDVHWRMADPHAFGAALSYAEIDREADIDSASGARRPGHVHALIAACVHRAAHHYDTPSLMLLCDIDRLARGLTAAEWERFAALVEAKHLRAVCLRGLDLASGAFGCVVPEPVRARLAAGESSEPTAAYVSGGLRRIDIFRDDWRELNRWRDRVQLLLGHLFPSPEYLGGDARGPGLARLYLLRFLRGAPAWFRPLQKR